MSRPRTMDLLAMLDRAGDEGLPAGALSRGFTEPVSITSRQALVNTNLLRLAGSGKVRRSDRKEASTYYHNTPVWRWFITTAGSEYLAQGGYKGRTERSRARREALAEAKAAHQRRIEEAVAGLATGHPRCTQVRNEQMIMLRKTGMTLEDLGALFGISRERARQIIAGRCGPCQCPEHATRQAGVSWRRGAWQHEAALAEARLASAGRRLPDRATYEPGAAGTTVSVTVGSIALSLRRTDRAEYAAPALGVPAVVLRIWLLEGRLPHSITAGGRYLVSTVELAQVIGGISERAGTVSRSSPGTGDEGGAGAPLARSADRAEPLPVPPDSRD